MKEADKQSGVWQCVLFRINCAQNMRPHYLRVALSLNSGMRSASLALFSGKHTGQQVYHDNFLFDLRSLLLT